MYEHLYTIEDNTKFLYQRQLKTLQKSNAIVILVTNVQGN